MAEREPVAAQPFRIDDARPAPTWAEARRCLAAAETYRLATAPVNGRPREMPVAAVWLDGALYVSAGVAARDGKLLARDAHCVITIGGPALELVVEGAAAPVSDAATLRRVAEVYAAKYDRQGAVRAGAAGAGGTPTAGPSPCAVYAVTPTLAFGFGPDGAFSPTRWRF